MMVTLSHCWSWLGLLFACLVLVYLVVVIIVVVGGCLRSGGVKVEEGCIIDSTCF